MLTAEEIAKYRRKLEGLMNMTVENGCSEDEQETAMRMAAGIAARIGISLDSVKPGGQTEAQRKAVRKAVNQELKIHQVLAAQAAARLYGCEVYVYDNGKGGVFFIGREENVDLTEKTMFWLMRQVELLYKQSLPKGMTQRDRAEFRKTFKAACAHRVYERAIALVYKMQQDEATAQATVGSNALVVQGYFKQLAQENNDYWKPTAEQEARYAEQARQREQREELRRNALTPAQRDAEDREAERYRKREARRAAKRKGPRARVLPTGNGTQAGFAAGDRIKLREELH
jgi:hypothetical protein